MNEADIQMVSTARVIAVGQIPTNETTQNVGRKLNEMTLGTDTSERFVQSLSTDEKTKYNLKRSYLSIDLKYHYQMVGGEGGGESTCVKD